MLLSKNEVVEFKLDHTSAINKTVFAFANTNGGTLYIGIADDGEIIGLRNADETMLKVSNSIHDTIKPDVTIYFRGINNLV